MVTPLLVLSVMLATTAAEWSFLRELGWSARERNDVGWPSILALGGTGWLVIVSLAIAGVLVVAFGVSLHQAMGTFTAQLGAFLIVLVGVALALVAFPADHPNVMVPSWHARIHDAAYPVIPLGSIAAASLLAWGLWDYPRWESQARVALAAALLIATAFLLTGFNAIGQVARYVLFAALLAWLQLLALGLLRVTARNYGVTEAEECL